MKKPKTILTDKSLDGLRSAQAEADTKQVARVLRQAGHAGVADRKLHDELGALPGYIFDSEVGRYLRQHEIAQSVGSVVATATLAENADRAFPALESVYSLALDKKWDPWHLPGLRHISASQAARAIHRAPNAVERYDRIRRALVVSSVVVNSAKAKGEWGSLPNGNLGASRVATALAEPFKSHPVRSAAELPEPSWSVLEVAAQGNDETSFVRRHQTFLRIQHMRLPVERHDPNGVPVERCFANRLFEVRQDTIFALSRSAADLAAEPEMLEEVYQSRGEGVEDMIVPAAGFVVVRQQVDMLGQE
jgi:hypothetical protein